MKVFFMFATITNFLLNIIFPVECLGCHRPDTWLCPACLGHIPLITQAVCPVCHRANNGSVCSRCHSQTALDGLLVATSYDQPTIQTMIHLLKYNFVTALAGPLATSILQYLATFDKNNRPAILQNPSETTLVSVPLHPRRYLERGFNQATLIAREISRQLNIPCRPTMLRRNRYTPAQAQLSKKERESNMRGAFTVNRLFKNLPKNVILIDDVATTLSTLNECAAVLKQAGCREVWGMVIARGS